MGEDRRHRDGRQTSMVVAAGDAAVDVLTLFSYPVHPSPDSRNKAETGPWPWPSG
ncbi:hypothetical protein MAHJHV55_52340 [Mycobacterium avium subsp. hominissuis]